RRARPCDAGPCGPGARCASPEPDARAGLVPARRAGRLCGRWTPVSAARPLDPWRWLGIPLIHVLAATVLFGIPLRVFSLQLPEPIFPMAVVFAWAVIRPSVLAPGGVLVMGLFLDLFWGGPLGFWALCLTFA